ncbi:MAG: Uma2 family endonuclease [Isosphaeraceae bacterium]
MLTDERTHDCAMMTAEEFLALPDDGTDRVLIDGKVLSWGPRIAARTRFQCTVEARIAKLLGIWLDGNPSFGGVVASGKAGFRLRRTPDSLVGADVAYVNAEVVSASPPSTPFFDGPPVLAVEILSPSDRHEEVVAKVRKYLEVGSVVWVVDPDFQMVTVHRPGELPDGLNSAHELSAEGYLPGFRVSVRALFE